MTTPRLVVTGLFGILAWAQSPGLTCAVTAVNPLIRAEGVAERLGDIVMDCSGGPNDGLITGNLTLLLNTTVTNRLSSQNTLDAILTVDTGGGPVTAGAPATLASTSSVTWSNLTFRLSTQGRATLRISNLRGIASASGAPLQSIQAFLAFNGASLLSFSNTRFSIGVPTQGLLASTVPAVLSAQIGSRVPEQFSFAEFIRAGTVFSSTRLTEGFAAAFEKRQPMADTGTRIVVRFGGFPTEARLFVPDLIAGSSASRPTAAGDFGGTPAAGLYVPNATGSLLLARVFNADSNGIGGFIPLVPPAGSGPVELGAANEVPLVNGRASVTYEVVDSNPAALETAQIPVFIGLPRSVEARVTVTTREVAMGPISTVFAASTNAPIPRYLGVPAPSDCTPQTSCADNFLPRLTVDPQAIAFTVEEGASFPIRFVAIDNAGGGTLVWNASVQYRSGSNFIRLSQISGVGGGSIRVDALTETLRAGVYLATLTVDAGAAGTRQIPITLSVTPRPGGPPPLPEIRSITNAASFRPGNIVAGSLATIFGANFGTAPTVTIDNLPATVLFANATQINLLVPAALAGRTSAQVVVTVSGHAGTALVTMAENAPGVFTPGILNQNNTVNRPDTPALASTVIQIFATGVFASGPDSVEVRLHDRVLSPLYAGPAPGFPGVQQINARVPVDLPAMTSDLQVCSRSICSPAVSVSIRQ